MNREISEIRDRFVEAAGHFTQSLGIGRAVGQSYAHIYFSREPQSLQNLQDVLGISKGSASMVVRQLEQWGALRRMWVKGDRKDYYVASDEFGRVIRRVLVEMVGQKMEALDGLLEEAQGVLKNPQRNDGAPKEEWAFMESRVRRIGEFRARAQGLWDSSIVRMLLKK